MWRTGLALLLVLGTPPAHADPPAAQDDLRELNARYNQLHAAKRYDEALGVLASMAARPDLAENQEAQASIAYARAGLETLLGRKDAAIEALRGALAGGFGDLGTLATDPDLD